MTKPRTKEGQFVKVGQVIRDILQTQRNHGDAKMIRVWEVWPSAVGERIAQHARPAVFKGSLLIVNVADSAWLQQLWFLKGEIVEQVNAGLGEDLVTTIKFKIGPI